MRKYSIDCEMVGSGRRSLLARVSVVDEDCVTMLDEYVKPTAKVTNYRTPVSGITPELLENAQNFDQVQSRVKELINGSILIGHSLDQDLGVLQLQHPVDNQRDLTKYMPFRGLVKNHQTPSLRFLATVYLGISIQDGEHDSVEDAKAAMEIYKKISGRWESCYNKI